MTPLAKAHKNKTFQTLQGHTEDALKILKAYIGRNSKVIEQFCWRWGIGTSDFLRSLYLTVYFHDIGKLTQQFQQNIREGKSSPKYPHALYGVYLLSHAEVPQLMDAPLELAAILGHHTQLYTGIYEREDIGKPRFIEDEIKKFVDDVETPYKKHEFDRYFNPEKINLRRVPRYRTGRVEDLLDELKNSAYSYKDKIKLKSIFTFLFSILQTCDDYASVAFEKFAEENPGGGIYDSVLEAPEEYVPVLEIDNPVVQILGDKKPYRYQEEIYNGASPFSMLFAPCGRGKTEAALLWALKIMREHSRNKIVFAMPTQTTSNAMYDRLCEIFGKENVGLFHGRSFIKLKSEKVDEYEGELEEKDLEEIKSETFKGNVFFKPVTVTTVDHLIYSFVHGFSQADFALGNLQNAVVVFDEVHYYERKTLEHLITLFRILYSMQIPHLLMSGTLPEFLKREVKKFGEYTIFEDTDGIKFKPFIIEFHREHLINVEANSKILSEIEANYNKNLNQFVILNTVDRAINFYKKLVELMGEDKNIILYHSRFIFRDRAKKEDEIMKKAKEKPLILVATQVIEISLDISCDVMYTELAPPDALGQRAGRLNRKGEKPESNGFVHKLKVFLPENELPYTRELLKYSEEELHKYLKACNYGDIKNFCDSVYDRVYKYLDIPSNLRDAFNECVIFGYSPSEIAFSEDEGKIIQIREENQRKIEVIPESMFLKYDEKALSVEFTTKVPLWWIKNEIDEFGKAVNFYMHENAKGKTFRICTFPYTYSIGLERRAVGKACNVI